MCKNAQEQFFQKTGKVMLFCRLKGDVCSLRTLCVCQRYCKDEDKYVETNPQANCKYYE